MGSHEDKAYALPAILSGRWTIEILIGIVAFTIYANTLGHSFAQDDAIVIYENMYVKEGFSGISKILTTDSFSGFFGGEDKSSLVSGGRYRPLSVILFAAVYQVVGAQSWAYHLLTVGVYAFLCILLYRVMMSVHTKWSSAKQGLFAITATLIYTVHPIHTEAVANAKGLDEILSLLFSLLALQRALSFVKNKSNQSLLLSAVYIFLALLAKENAAAFIVIIPIVIWSFPFKTGNHQALLAVAGVLLFSFIGYWVLRTSIVGSSFGDPPLEMMNNPFIKVVDGKYISFSGAEKWASIIYGLGKYIQLVFFPHPLTHDYYPRHFGVVDFKDLAVWMSVLMNAILVLIAVIGIRKRSFISFIIFFFYATIGLMSNVIFPIGTHLSERFLFTPSIAIALFIAYAFVHFRKSKKYRVPAVITLGLLVMLSSLKTITRNAAWKNDLTLFTTDVQVSKNSAKVQNAAGGALLSASYEEQDETVKEDMIRKSISHLNKAVEIHPNYKEPYLLAGNAYSLIKDYDQSISSYEKALVLSPQYELARKNLLIVLKEGAKQVGGVQRNYLKARTYLSKVLELSPRDFDALALMGTAYGSSGDHKEAIEFFERAISIKPDIAITYVNLGVAQLNIGLEEDAQINFNKAVQIDPNALDQIQN